MYHDVPWIDRPLVTSEDKSDVVLTGNIELVFYYYSVARMQSKSIHYFYHEHRSTMHRESEFPKIKLKHYHRRLNHYPQRRD